MPISMTASMARVVPMVTHTPYISAPKYRTVNGIEIALTAIEIPLLTMEETVATATRPRRLFCVSTGSLANKFNLYTLFSCL